MKTRTEILNSPDLLSKIQEISPEITHLPGNWDFRTTEQKEKWLSESVPFGIFIEIYN